MVLSTEKYNTIIREYEDIRLKNHHTFEERREYVYKNVEGYKELDDSVVTVSMDMAKKQMAGEDGILEELHALLEDLKSMKRSLLKGAGLPEDYLEPIYDCPDCKDTGYVNGERCHCLKNRINTELCRQSNIGEYLDVNNFSNLSYDYYDGTDLESFRRAVKIAHELIDTYTAEHKNILFYGTVGTGKSFLSGCIAREMIDKGYSVIYFSSITFFELIAKETFGNNSKEDLYNPLEYIYNCDVLIIDDLGTELNNNFVASRLFHTINERNLRCKSTVISTNLSFDELRDRYSERVTSRLMSTYTLCRLSGRDIRLQRLERSTCLS